jgi:hypothetical protein
MFLLLRAVCALLALVTLVGTAAAQSIDDGTSNTVVVGERPLGSTGCTVVTTRGPAPGGPPDAPWTSIYLRPTATLCGLPIATPVCPLGRQPLTRILDASPNTIYVGEALAASCVAPIGEGRCAVRTLPGITDGTSNTLLVGELLPPVGGPEPLECALPVGESGCTLGGPGSVVDGTSNTITFGYAGGAQGCLLPVAGTRDLPDVRVGADGGICTPTPGGIRDGTSNTIIVGECAAGTVAPEPGAGALLAGGLLGLLPAAAAARRRRRS